MSGDLRGRVRALEGRAAERRDSASSWGITWAGDHVPLGRELQPGERLVVDVYQGGSLGPGARVARTVERAATSAADRGRVFNSAGEEVGVVDEKDGGLLRLHS